MPIEASIPEENLFWEGAHTNRRTEVQKSSFGAEVLQEALKVQELHLNFFKTLMCKFRQFFGAFWQ